MGRALLGVDVAGRVGVGVWVDVGELRPKATCRLLALNPKCQTPYAEV